MSLFNRNAVNRPAGSTQEAKQRAAESPRPTGLTASQKFGMMGAGRDAIDAADQAERKRQEREKAEEELIERQGEMVGLFKKMTSGIVGFVSGLAVFPKVAERWTSALVESRRHLAQYNGTLASAHTQLDISRLRMDMRTADATAGSTANVVEELKRLQEKMQMFREMKDTVSNGFATMFLGIASAIVSAGADVSESIGLTAMIRHLEELMGRQQQQQPMMPLHQAVQEMMDKFGRDNSGIRPPLPPLKP
ncbi:MAG: hypothetical protein KDA52_05225 [Planctomycetaceae bacterium]|nr:hypothetical protein [Planctomycetaceae bacterium]